MSQQTGVWRRGTNERFVATTTTTTLSIKSLALLFLTSIFEKGFVVVRFRRHPAFCGNSGGGGGGDGKGWLFFAAASIVWKMRRPCEETSVRRDYEFTPSVDR